MGVTSTCYEEIARLKSEATYEFFHGSLFPGQGSSDEPCFVFKMSTTGIGSGVDLVNRMRRNCGGDLSTSWVHFDHTHRVRGGWVTLGCHVYNPLWVLSSDYFLHFSLFVVIILNHNLCICSMQEVQTIATCEMRTEDVPAISKFWRCINEVMEKKGFAKAEFTGFVADEAQANWIAVREVFNEGEVMEGRERSCHFHWEQSLVTHITRSMSRIHARYDISKCVKFGERRRHCGWHEQRRERFASFGEMKLWMKSI